MQLEVQAGAAIDDSLVEASALFLQGEFTEKEGRGGDVGGGEEPVINFATESSACIFRREYLFRLHGPPGTVLSEGGLPRASPDQYTSAGTKGAF